MLYWLLILYKAIIYEVAYNGCILGMLLSDDVEAQGAIDENTTKFMENIEAAI